MSKYGFYIIDSSISNYDPSLSSDSEWDKLRHPSERKEVKKLGHVTTDNITNKD